MIEEHVETLGKLPDEWWEVWEAKRKWFDDDGVRVHGGPGRGLEERFRTSILEPRKEMSGIGGIEGSGGLRDRRRVVRCLR